MYALVVDGMIAILASEPPETQSCPNGKWQAVVDTPRPADTPTSRFIQSIHVVDGNAVMVWDERQFTPTELVEMRRGTVTADLVAKARAALTGNSTALTAATTGQIASFVSLTDAPTGTTVASAFTAIGQNRQAVDWLVARDIAHEKQLTAIIRLLVGGDLLDNTDGT